MTADSAPALVSIWVQRSGTWRRSSFHGPDLPDAAVECYRYGDGVIGLQRSDWREWAEKGPARLFSAAAWSAFVAGVKNGEFDIPEHCDDG